MTSTLPHVLLVEDDPVSRAFLGAAIQAVPATVDAADTMAAAFALATAGPYDLWLFDANLPDGSGIELLTRLRARDAGNAGAGTYRVRRRRGYRCFGCSRFPPSIGEAIAGRGGTNRDPPRPGSHWWKRRDAGRDCFHH